MNSEESGYIDLGFAKVDIARQQRCGHAEVIFGRGKTAEHILKIALTLKEHGQPVLVTRTPADAVELLLKELPGAVHHELSHIVSWAPTSPSNYSKTKLSGKIALCAGGTSDLPIAEEARLTAEFLGAEVTTFYDIGVAGLHRLLNNVPQIREHTVIIAVAGMEGALPSVIAGQVDKPVIGVPTSIGYGAAQEGMAALAGMLTSCGSGLTVVNIDNGFGGAYAACKILRLLE